MGGNIAFNLLGEPEFDKNPQLAAAVCFQPALDIHNVMNNMSNNCWKAWPDYFMMLGFRHYMCQFNNYQVAGNDYDQKFPDNIKDFAILFEEMETLG